MFLTCPLLSTQKTVSHGFFTRRGGHSTGLYDSLNCGLGSGDDLAVVARNRNIVAQALGGDTLCTAYQIHSPHVATLTSPWDARSAPEADAIVTAIPGVALGILTADCVPVLFSDSAAGVIGAAHAGWKGAYGGVVEATITAMTRLGASRARIAASIGPAIAQHSYEVGPEFRERLVFQDTANAQFFIPSHRPGHQWFNLKSYVHLQLEKAHIAAINELANDTASEEDDFFSFRRATLRQEPVYGRQISAIMLQK